MYVSWVGIGEVQKNYQLNGTAVVHLFTGKITDKNLSFRTLKDLYCLVDVH